MKEIGGYIELDTYSLPMLHESAIGLNCGRNGLVYLIRSRQIKKILMPWFMCDSVIDACVNAGVQLRYYEIDEAFLPRSISLEHDEWLYLTNFYGQVSNDIIQDYVNHFGRVIVDNIQDYFRPPVAGVDTLYTCRKFFGVADGAFLYTDAPLQEELPLDESFRRMNFLLGRFERSASEFYGEYAANNELFDHEPVKRMSKLTENLLRGIDYDKVRDRRTENFRYLHEQLQTVNRLQLKQVEGPFMYPLWVTGGPAIRKALAAQKIYIPTLWPNVLEMVGEDTLEYDFAANILPLPVDQRYDKADLDRMIRALMACL